MSLTQSVVAIVNERGAELFTLEWIKLRCRPQMDSDCMLWAQGTNPAGAPIATKLLPTGKKPTVQLRRVVWEHKHGPIPDGMLVTVSCGHATCLQHLELTTKSEVIRRQWAKTEARAKLVAGVTKKSRQRGKLDMEAARDIRHSNEPLEVCAARHGVSMTLASLVRRGLRWREERNPFAGLGA